jgi:hypothetical protein
MTAWRATLRAWRASHQRLTNGAAGETHAVAKASSTSHGALSSTNRGEWPGITTSESAQLRAARRRIRELETELAIVRQAATFLDQDKSHPKGFTR